MTDTRLITIRHHHDNPDLALLGTPPELATVMGRFQPARYVGLRSGSYVITNDQIPALTRFAAAQNITLIDERRTTSRTTVGPAQPLPECAHCGAPATRTTHPNHCPGCGQPWRPIQRTPASVDTHPTIGCTTCGRTQRTGFRYCTGCGAPLATRQAQPEPAPTPRQYLDDPLPLAEAIDDVLQQQTRT